LDFDEPVYQGKAGLQIDFGLVYGALSRIAVIQQSIEKENEP
jgi:hypothetical protein